MEEMIEEFKKEWSSKTDKEKDDMFCKSLYNIFVLINEVTDMRKRVDMLIKMVNAHTKDLTGLMHDHGKETTDAEAYDKENEEAYKKYMEEVERKKPMA